MGRGGRGPRCSCGLCKLRCTFGLAVKQGVCLPWGERCAQLLGRGAGSAPPLPPFLFGTRQWQGGSLLSRAGGRSWLLSLSPSNEVSATGPSWPLHLSRPPPPFNDAPDLWHCREPFLACPLPVLLLRVPDGPMAAPLGPDPRPLLPDLGTWLPTVTAEGRDRTFWPRVDGRQ